MSNSRSQTERDYRAINLHDANVQHISIDGTDVSIALGFVRFDPSHPDNPLGVTAIARNCVLQFHRVSSSSASLYDNSTRSFRPHPCSLEPFIGNIVDADCCEVDGVAKAYKFGGWHDRLGAWVEWSIQASGFTLSWANELAAWQ